MKPKKELIRIVKSADGVVDVDPTGKKPGRGAYICTEMACFNSIRKLKRLDKALVCIVDDRLYEIVLEKLRGTDG
jgi:predicted RNA-binding protein YlxR (DUF448 family)